MVNSVDIFYEVADKENLTITALERAIGASKGVISRAKKNNSDIQMKWFLSLVENFPLHDYSKLIHGQEERKVSEPLQAYEMNQERKNIEAILSAVLSSKKEIMSDLKGIVEGMTINFENVAESLFQMHSDQQKILRKLDQADFDRLNQATNKILDMAVPK